MTHKTDAWITESSKLRLTAAASAGAVIGLFLVVGSAYLGDWTTSATSAFGLGLLMLAISGIALIVAPSEIVKVDGKGRKITISVKHRFGESTKQILFEEISSLDVGEFGDNDGGSVSYHVGVLLKNGKKIPRRSANVLMI